MIFIVASIASFKVIADDGFDPTEFVLMRCVSAFPIALIWCIILGHNPLKLFPWDNKWTLVWRCLTGHIKFFLLNWGVSMAPVSIIMVTFQTNPFWISLTARLWLKEPIILLELLGMCICFAMVGVIASQAKNDE